MMKEQLLKKQRNHALIGPAAGLVMKKLEAFSLSSYDLIRHSTLRPQDTQVTTAQFPSDSPLCDPFVGICSAQLPEPLRLPLLCWRPSRLLQGCQRLQKPKGCSPIPGKNGSKSVKILQQQQVGHGKLPYHLPSGNLT